MNSLIIESTEFSPKIYFNPKENKFEISGESRPENTSKFYAQLNNWVNEFSDFLSENPSASNLLFEFKFEYFNSTSAKFLLDFLQKLEELSKKNAHIKISIRWFYDKQDEDMRDSGEEFSQLVNLPFEFIML